MCWPYNWFIENQTTNRPWKRLVDVLQKHSHTSALVISPYPLTIPWNTIKWQLLCSNMFILVGLYKVPLSSHINSYKGFWVCPACIEYRTSHMEFVIGGVWDYKRQTESQDLVLASHHFPYGESHNHMYICTSIVAYENILCTCIQKAVHTYTWHAYRKHIHKHTNTCNILNTNTHTYITLHHLTSHYMHTHTYEQPSNITSQYNTKPAHVHSSIGLIYTSVYVNYSLHLKTILKSRCISISKKQ